MFEPQWGSQLYRQEEGATSVPALQSERARPYVLNAIFYGEHCTSNIVCDSYKNASDEADE